MVQKVGGRTSERRREIIRRAAEVFRRKGFHGAGMREIAKSLGIVPGALYYYFESKEELLYACQTLAVTGLLRSAREIEALDLPAGEKIRRLVRSHLDHVLGEQGGGLAHVELRALPRGRLDEVIERRDEYEALVRRVIEEGAAAGEFRPVDGKLTALALLGSLNWTAVWWRPDGGDEVPDVAERFADLYIEGLSR